mmetsp:Transcript_124237/g.397686  ORF Transcript_124237/g.397686 Transcript_124237/m.397686 type:complete len:113 (-) Transcript_124237:169-507(-)
MFNSALFAARPSESTFGALARRAAEGGFAPYTNSEQDVLNAHFQDGLAGNLSIDDLVPHEHWCSKPESPWLIGEHCLRKSDSSLLLRMASAGAGCEEFWSTCISYRLGDFRY